MLIQLPPVDVGADVWMLGTSAYPVYLVRGQREGAIVEGGISALRPLLASQLKQMGVAPDYVRQAIVTHAHPDHVMAIPVLREMFPGLSVVASSAAAKTLSVDKAVGYFRQVDGALADVLFKAGTIAEIVPLDMAENRIAVDRTVQEGDVITVDHRELAVLQTPGHSDCSISLYESGRGLLIISDATGYYMPTADAWWPNYFWDYGAYVQSIERLAALDAQVVCLSHNGALRGQEDVRAYFAGALAATRQYHEHIVAEIKAGKPVRQLAEELGAEAHRHTPVLPVDFFQKNCSLLVKQSLKYEGLTAA